MNFGQYTGIKLGSDLEEMKEHEEEQRSEGDLIILDIEQRDLYGKKKTREEEDKFLKKKKGRRRTQRNRVRTQLKQQPVDCQHSRQSHLRPLLLLLLLLSSSPFFFFSFVDGDHSVMCSLSLLSYFVTPFCVLNSYFLGLSCDMHWNDERF